MLHRLVLGGGVAAVAIAALMALAAPALASPAEAPAFKDITCETLEGYDFERARDDAIVALIDRAQLRDPSAPTPSSEASPCPVTPAKGDDLADANLARQVNLVTGIPVPGRKPPTPPGYVRPKDPEPSPGFPSLDVMVGQMLMVGFSGNDVGQAGPKRIARHLADGTLGGVLFFKHNVKSEAAVKRLTTLFREAAEGHPVPLIAVDQEGGRVQRVTRRVGFTNTPSARRLAQSGDAPSAKRIYRRLASDLSRWGFNVNLAPVVDLGMRRDNPVITRMERAYSGDPATVGAFAGAFVDAHRDAGVLTALKHFPGHGSSAGDTHHGFVDVSSTWTRNELIPFRSLIDGDQVDMVMVAHVHLGGVAGIRQTRDPATLSSDIIEGLLRTELGYDGVVISDDMEMGAITKLGSPVEVASRAILAGNDILVFAGGAAPGRDLVAVLQSRIRQAARDPAVMRRIEQSYIRIVRMKAPLGGDGVPTLRRRLPVAPEAADAPTPTDDFRKTGTTVPNLAASPDGS
ncbi:MAG: glycoside hydrolase family 3 N-terminal domain-containing protein [Pseudomonadota bacterium]